MFMIILRYLSSAKPKIMTMHGHVYCLLNRYCREAEKDAPQRRLCGLKIGQVEKVQTRQIASEKGQFYNLLSIGYVEAENLLILTFSGGAAIRVYIGEIMLTLRDVAEAHPSFARPVHG